MDSIATDAVQQSAFATRAPMYKHWVEMTMFQMHFCRRAFVHHHLVHSKMSKTNLYYNNCDFKVQGTKRGTLWTSTVRLQQKTATWKATGSRVDTSECCTGNVSCVNTRRTQNHTFQAHNTSKAHHIYSFTWRTTWFARDRGFRFFSSCPDELGLSAVHPPRWNSLKFMVIVCVCVCVLLAANP